MDTLSEIELSTLIAAFLGVMKTVGFSGATRPGLPFYPVATGKLFPDGSAYRSCLAGCGREIPLLAGTAKWETFAQVCWMPLKFRHHV